MKKKIIVNPFLIFFIIILFVLLTYSLSWSELNTPLSISVLLFFVFVLISLLFFSQIYNRIFPPGTFENKRFKVNLIPWTIIGLGSMFAEFAYEKVIPIVDILILKNGYNYVDFEGIPVFHVFAVTFTSFLGLYYWSIFLEDKKKIYLFFAVFFVSFPIMLFNRGGLVMNISSMFFIFLFYKKTLQVSMKMIVGFIGTMLIFLYAFGLFGNIRSDSENAAIDIKNSEFILNVGEATEEFKDSSIPKPFFWGYLYVSTPIANLQNMTEKIEPSNDPLLFITQSVLPDFISKRVESNFNLKVQEDQRVSPVFNVSTIFAPAYKTLGFVGMILIYYYLVLFIFIYAYMMKKMNTTKIIGISILLTIVIFNLFSNMLIFSGLSFQLIYPILFWLYKTCRG